MARLLADDGGDDEEEEEEEEEDNDEEDDEDNDDVDLDADNGEWLFVRSLQAVGGDVPKNKVFIW